MNISDFGWNFANCNIVIFEILWIFSSYADYSIEEDYWGKIFSYIIDYTIEEDQPESKHIVISKFPVSILAI